VEKSGEYKKSEEVKKNKVEKLNYTSRASIRYVRPFLSRLWISLCTTVLLGRFVLNNWGCEKLILIIGHDVRIRAVVGIISVTIYGSILILEFFFEPLQE
jgi:hypothetical protein